CAGRPAQAAADIQHPYPWRHAGEVGEPHSRRLATAAKLIGWREVVNGEGIELLARGNEGIEDGLPEALAAPVVIHRPGGTRVTHMPLRMASEAQQDT